MREIKYRAWERHLKEIIPVYEIDFENQRINDNFAWRMIGEVELMQYTGQHDKNEKDVFEGDVAEIQQPTSVTRGQIVFREGAFAFLSEPWPNGERDVVYLHSIKFQADWKLEVIGNIYENGELLGGKSA